MSHRDWLMANERRHQMRLWSHLELAGTGGWALTDRGRAEDERLLAAREPREQSRVFADAARAWSAGSGAAATADGAVAVGEIDVDVVDRRRQRQGAPR